jgi:serine phosphatase RsbU (regulator of sigma subunit)
MGKEMSAALLMTTLRSALRTTFNQGNLETVLAQVSATLLSDFEKLGSFATVFHGRLDPQNRHLLYVCAGHTCGLMLRADGKIEWLEEAQLPLGIVAQEIYQCYECQFSPGDCLVLYTRGVFRSFPQKELEKIAEKGYVIEMNEPKKNAVATMEWFFQQTEDQGQAQDRTVLVLNCLT